MSIETWLKEHPKEFQDWVTKQRWFGDKSRQVDQLETVLIAEFSLEDDRLWLLRIHFTFGDGEESTYFVPLVERHGDQPADGLNDPRFLAWIGAGFVDQVEIDLQFGGGSRLSWSRSNAGANTDWTREDPRVLEGEQSNSSVLFGKSAIAKVFRKLQPGINPDSEIVSFLTEHGDFAHVPPFLGSVTLDFDDGSDSIELVAVQGFVPNQGDCWRWLPDALAGANEDELAGLVSSIKLLGSRTGELHVALSHGDQSDAFRPIVMDNADVSGLEQRLGREVRLTTSMLHRQGACSYVESEDLAASLLLGVSRAEVLRGYLKTRVHGDYHLGQVLRTERDFVIIDFEGEPSRSMAERREMHSPLKDVAGMLRSIDYAVATASATVERDRATTFADWGRHAEQAFLEGYSDIVGGTSLPLVPLEPVAFRQALDLYMIEKALYEVRYELDNRPDWLDIPFGALKRIGESG